MKEKLDHKYGFLEPGLLRTNYAKKSQVLGNDCPVKRAENRL